MLEKILSYFKQRRFSMIMGFLVLGFAGWSMISINLAIANSPGRMVWDYTPIAPNVDRDDPGEYVSVARSGNLELFFNDKNGAVQVLDLRNGHLWESVASEESYNIGRLNPLWTAQVQSALAIDFNNLRQRDAPPASLFSYRDMDYIETELLPNGAAVIFGFTVQGIFVRIEYTLEDGEFVVRIPGDGIREYSNFAVTSLGILPYFGAANDFVDGYMLYPDGSGGLTRFENRNTRPLIVNIGMWYTYSHRVISMENLMESDQYLRYAASLPVYGIKYNDNAFIAAITRGAENAGIMAYPSGRVINLNRIHFELYPRNIFNVRLDNITVGGSNSLGRTVQRIDRELIREDREIRYFMLSGEDANYSGMARIYRDYLINTGQLTDSIAPGSGMPLSMHFVMGAPERQMVFDTFHDMTSFRDLIHILGRLEAEGVNDVNAVLMSWTRNGYSPPRYWPPASQLGGNGGLRDIDGFLDRRSGFNVFLENNFVFAMNGNGGFSSMNDIVYNGASSPITSESSRGGTRSGGSRGGASSEYFLLNPAVSLQNHGSFLNQMRQFNNLYIAYQNIGRIIYNDYNSRSPFSKSETVRTWQAMLAEGDSQTGRVAVRGMNQYVLQSADYLYDVPMRAFGLNITDEHIPFVQMVVSGMIPYSGEPGNLSFDLDIEKLKWIEYGAIPTFTITYENPIRLRNTIYDWLFTSAFYNWESRILDIYNEFKDNLSDVYGHQIISHEVLMRNVIRIEYDNNISVYINYTNDYVSIGDIRIPPVDYVVVRLGA